jgi:threonine dehydrogenase-like Zn-dependent dehydrogenase
VASASSATDKRLHMYWEELLKLIQKGDIDPLKMVSHRVKFEELDNAYYKFEKKDGMQVLVQMSIAG